MKRRKATRRAWSIYANSGKKEGAYAAGAQMRRGKDEHDHLQEVCMEIAKREFKLEAFRTDAARVYVGKDKSGEPQFRTMVTVGLPDFNLPIPPTGRWAGFEVKIGKALLRKKQRQRRDNLVAQGAPVFTVRSTEEFRQFIRLLLAMEAEKHQIVQQAREAGYGFIQVPASDTFKEARGL